MRWPWPPVASEEITAIVRWHVRETSEVAEADRWAALRGKSLWRPYPHFDGWRVGSEINRQQETPA